MAARKRSKKVKKQRSVELGTYSGKPVHVEESRLTRVVRPGYAFLCKTGRAIEPGGIVPKSESIEGQTHKLMKKPLKLSIDQPPKNRAMRGAPKSKGTGGRRRKTA